MNFRKTYLSILSATFALGVILFPVMALAEARPGGPDGALGGACAGCGCLAALLFLLAVAALHIVILVWVARDAKARGMDSPVLWLIVVILTGLIGLIVYLFARPQGNLVPCTHCQKKRLQASANVRTAEMLDEATLLACTGAGSGRRRHAG